MKTSKLLEVAKAKAANLAGEGKIVPCLDHKDFHDGLLEIEDTVFFWFDHVKHRKRQTYLIQLASDDLAETQPEQPKTAPKAKYDIAAISMTACFIVLFIALITKVIQVLF